MYVFIHFNWNKVMFFVLHSTSNKMYIAFIFFFPKRLLTKITAQCIIFRTCFILNVSVSLYNCAFDKWYRQLILSWYYYIYKYTHHFLEHTRGDSLFKILSSLWSTYKVIFSISLIHSMTIFTRTLYSDYSLPKQNLKVRWSKDKVNVISYA